MQIIYIFLILYSFTNISYSRDIQKKTTQKVEEKCKLKIIADQAIIKFESKNCKLIDNKSKKTDEKSKKIIYYHHFFLKNPDRFVFDIHDKNIDIKILTNKKINFQTRHNKQDFGYRFVANIQAKTSILKTDNKIECKIHHINEKFKETIKDEKYEIDPKKFTITIDAGHGGKDPGCIGGKNKKHEKDITLDYALDLRNILLSKNFNVILTRKTDKYVNLRKRVEIATEHKSDMFISLHVDALKSHKPGTTVYIISDINIKHTDRNLFYTESYTPKNILKNYTRMIQNLLIDIYHKDTKQKARVLSQKILKRLKSKNLCNGTCKPKERSFGVLRRVDMPSILIELGFINNEEDEKRLLSSEYKKEILDNIASGIADYIDASTNR